VIVHRPTDIEEQQDLNCVVSLGYESQIEKTCIARGGIDRRLEIQLIGDALTRELS